MMQHRSDIHFFQRRQRIFQDAITIDMRSRIPQQPFQLSKLTHYYLPTDAFLTYRTVSLFHLTIVYVFPDCTSKASARKKRFIFDVRTCWSEIPDRREQERNNSWLEMIGPSKIEKVTVLGNNNLILWSQLSWCVSLFLLHTACE